MLSSNTRPFKVGGSKRIRTDRTDQEDLLDNSKGSSRLASEQAVATAVMAEAESAEKYENLISNLIEEEEEEVSKPFEQPMHMIRLSLQMLSKRIKPPSFSHHQHSGIA